MATIGYTRRSRKQDNGSYGLDDQRAKLEARSAYRERPLDRVTESGAASRAATRDPRPSARNHATFRRSGDGGERIRTSVGRANGFTARLL